MAFRSKVVPLEVARWSLGAIWFAGAGLIFILLIIQSLFNAYEGYVQGVWGWVLPNLAPVLSLMLGVFGGAALADHSETDEMNVRRPFFWLAIGLSVFHILCLGLTLAVHPFLPSVMGTDGSPDPMAAFIVSNLWLGPIQGLVAAALGALFFTKTAAKMEGQGGTN